MDENEEPIAYVLKGMLSEIEEQDEVLFEDINVKALIPATTGSTKFSRSRAGCKRILDQRIHSSRGDDHGKRPQLQSEKDRLIAQKLELSQRCQAQQQAINERTRRKAELIKELNALTGDGIIPSRESGDPRYWKAQYEEVQRRYNAQLLDLERRGNVVRVFHKKAIPIPPPT